MSTSDEQSSPSTDPVAPLGQETAYASSSEPDSATSRASAPSEESLHQPLLGSILDNESDHPEDETDADALAAAATAALFGRSTIKRHGVSTTLSSWLKLGRFRMGTAKPKPRPPTPDLLGVQRTVGMFPVAANVSALTYFILLGSVYYFTPRDQWQYLPDAERQAAWKAFLVLVLSNVLILSRFTFHRKWKRHMVGIVYASMLCQAIAILTNWILACAPTVVLVDPITHSRVFLVRWCEWIPLAGLMTFFSEGVGITKETGGVKRAVYVSLSQSLSCLCGLLFPLCPGLLSWLVCLVVSISTFAVIFPRVAIKRIRYHDKRYGQGHRSFVQREELDRLRFSYELMLVCSWVWAGLVVMYFFNMVAHRMFPEGHVFRYPPLAMVVDTMFDVFAKGIYLKLIVDVHFAVFDAEGRAQRQLSELRNLISVLWDASSDAIVISARFGNKITSLLSPSFLKLVNVTLPEDLVNRKSIALLIETERLAPTQNPQGDEVVNVVSCSYVDCSEIPFGGLLRESILVEVSSSTANELQASGLIAAAWNHADKSDSEVILMYQFQEERKCEVKVSPHSDNTLVAVVRDVTERYKRMEAERKAHSETVARQKDAQSQTRFVRHEVKNGLLAGIELCDGLRNAIDDLERTARDCASTQSLPDGLSMSTPILRRQSSTLGTTDDERDLSRHGSNATFNATPSGRTRRLMEDLDVTLHEVLDTVLAEAMARDVIHEVYQPRSERLDVLALFTSSGSKAGKTERFSVVSTTKPEIPYLMLDPQLLRYIHRNAISNACKYGKQGGMVLTELSYDMNTKSFCMHVKNDPGPGHEKLVALGEKASEVVFAQGSMLHRDENHQSSYISSGDGAWIMQKCAKTMRGSCAIEFRESQTIFTFTCPAEPLSVIEWPDTQDFMVPPDTWGIAVDDSKIQRKLIARILGYVGIDESKSIVLGHTPSEVFDLENVILNVISQNPSSKIFILVDENLDFGESDGEPVVLSGSLIMKEILSNLTPQQEAQCFVLVRSANDSSDDVALYSSRTHGFFPKAPMQRQRIRELLAPLWAERFLNYPHHSPYGSPSSSVTNYTHNADSDDLDVPLSEEFDGK